MQGQDRQQVQQRALQQILDAHMDHEAVQEAQHLPLLVEDHRFQVQLVGGQPEQGPQEHQAKADGDVEDNGQQHLVFGEAVPDGHGRVKQQALAHAAGQQDQQQFRAVAHQVPGGKGRLLDGLPDRLSYVGQEPEDLLQAHVGGEMEDRQQHQACADQPSEEEPAAGGDQLGPDQGVDADRQGEHQIALVPQQVFIEAVDHDDHGQHRRREEAQEEQDDHKAQDQVHDDAVCIVYPPEGEVGHARQQRQSPQHGQHDPPGGVEFMLQKLA